MVITIIAEPRTGSTNLLKWFDSHIEYTTGFEPLTNTRLFKKFLTKSLTFTDYKDISTWKYDTPNLVVKELSLMTEHHDTLIKNSDKVIVLFRENYKEQLESFSCAKSNENWFNKYLYTETNLNDTDLKLLNNTKNNIDYYKSKYFSISYEDLYYRKKIKEVINYLEDDSLYSISFPFGKKYRLYEKSII